MYLYAPLFGLLGSGLVASTGVGGGILLLPLQVIGLRVPPIVAVGSDVILMFFTKRWASLLHWRRKNIGWKLTVVMLTGSIPGSLAGIALLAFLRYRLGEGVHSFLRITVGLVLVLHARDGSREDAHRGICFRPTRRALLGRGRCGNHWRLSSGSHVRWLLLRYHLAPLPDLPAIPASLGRQRHLPQCASHGDAQLDSPSDGHGGLATGCLVAVGRDLRCFPGLPIDNNRSDCLAADGRVASLDSFGFSML